ncbi:4Fe-4S binding protein [bacterium]|nr:4Fe-4S binding protein [bacterium]
MRKKIFTLGRIRIAVAAILVLGVTYTGTKYQLDWGTLCSYCPVGLLQVMLAAKTLAISKTLFLSIPILIFALFLGRLFCAWGCPVTLTRDTLNQKSHSGERKKSSGTLQNIDDYSPVVKKGKGLSQYTTYCVFVLTLILSFSLGFPVFCLICPIGLFFGFCFSLWKLSTLYQPGWELIIFPSILFVELFLFRSWCSSICPVGLIFKLTGALGRTFGVALRPIVKSDSCLSQLGSNCKICSKVCPEQIDLQKPEPKLLDDCTLCLECYTKCGKDAITIKPELFRKKHQLESGTAKELKN